MHCKNKKVVFTGKVISSYLQNNILFGFHESEVVPMVTGDSLINENVTSIKTSPITNKRQISKNTSYEQAFILLLF